MKAVLHDVTRCTGCNRCVAACADENGLEGKESHARFSRSGLSAHRWTTVVREAGRYVRRQCLHCEDPSCAAACLVGAFRKTPEGPVVYDASKCIGCRYCMLACPFEIPRYEWDTNHPFVRKCDLCHDRPGGPACIEACPNEVSLYGDREELLEVARARIRAAPDRYLDHVFGEKEAGGTSVLYLSDVDLSGMWPARMGDRSVPEMTWPVVSKTPFLAFGVAGVLTGLSWIVHRRNRRSAEAQEESK